jgi:hypothetical protein
VSLDQAEGNENMGKQAVYRTDAGTWQVEKQGEALYRLGSAGDSAGFIERVGSVWVALAGTRLDRCVEVGQSTTFDRAAALLVEHRRP